MHCANLDHSFGSTCTCTCTCRCGSSGVTQSWFVTSHECAPALATWYFVSYQRLLSTCVPADRAAVTDSTTVHLDFDLSAQRLILTLSMPKPLQKPHKCCALHPALNRFSPVLWCWDFVLLTWWLLPLHRATDCGGNWAESWHVLAFRQLTPRRPLHQVISDTLNRAEPTVCRVVRYLRLIQTTNIATRAQPGFQFVEIFSNFWICSWVYFVLKFFERSKSLGTSMNGYQDTERVIGPLLSGECSLFTCSTCICTCSCCFLSEIDTKGPPGMVLAHQSLFPPTYLSPAFVSLKCSSVL